MKKSYRTVLGGTAVLLSAAMLTGCSNGSDSSGSSSSSGSSANPNATIGLLLPDTVTPRYASADRPLFTAEVKRQCSGCTVLYENAAASASTQQQQAQSMLTQGVDVLVLDAQDGEAATQIVNLAQRQHVPVISYDRLIDSPDIAAYVSFDNRKVGQLQAQSLIDRMKAQKVPSGAGIIMANGSPTDNNAKDFKAGAHSVIDDSGYDVLGEYDTPDWLPAKAQAWAQGEIAKDGAKNIKGVYAANDDVAAAIITALQGAGVSASDLPPVTGQDASLAGVQRIVAGTQYMTVYKAFKPEATTAADYAVRLSRGEKLSLPETATTAKGAKVPAKLFNPVAVTTGNIDSTVVKDGLYTVDQICTSRYQARCQQIGLR